jgi:hypothetical protein
MTPEQPLLPGSVWGCRGGVFARRHGATRHGIYGTNTGGGHGAGGAATEDFAAGVHGINDTVGGYGVWVNRSRASACFFRPVAAAGVA